jgi:hypothetical protein
MWYLEITLHTLCGCERTMTLEVKTDTPWESPTYPEHIRADIGGGMYRTFQAVRRKPKHYNEVPAAITVGLKNLDN